jgi:hypothetical protein
MAKKVGQLETISYIRKALIDRGHKIASRSVGIRGEEQCIVFEREQRSIGVDAGAGLWAKESEAGEWRCLEKPCTVGGALEAVEFLIKE